MDQAYQGQHQWKSSSILGRTPIQCKTRLELLHSTPNTTSIRTRIRWTPSMNISLLHRISLIQKGPIPWDEIGSLYNVSGSRCRKHFYVICSPDERERIRNLSSRHPRVSVSEL